MSNLCCCDVQLLDRFCLKISVQCHSRKLKLKRASRSLAKTGFFFGVFWGPKLAPKKVPQKGSKMDPKWDTKRSLQSRKRVRKVGSRKVSHNRIPLESSMGAILLLFTTLQQGQGSQKRVLFETLFGTLFGPFLARKGS